MLRVPISRGESVLLAATVLASACAAPSPTGNTPGSPPVKVGPPAPSAPPTLEIRGSRALEREPSHLLGFQAPASQGSKQVTDASKMAAKLSNPTEAVASLTNNLDYKKFKGDLPDSSDQEAFTWSFQPTLPFPLDDGNNILLRPNIPFLLRQPVFDASSLSFENERWEVGDTGFDLIYGGTTKKGLVWFVGVNGALPTHTQDDVGTDAWTLGPEAFIGYEQKWGIVGGLFGHQWKYAGPDEVDLTSGQYVYAFHLPQIGPGWQLTSSPTWSYDHEADSDDALTLPFGVGLSKTTKLGERFWKFQLQYWYFVEQPDTFGEDWQIRLSITPVFKVPWAETHH